MINLRAEEKGPITRTPAQFGSLLNHNTVTAINSVLTTARQIAREPIPSGPSGIKNSIQLEKAKISTASTRLETTHPLFGVVEEDTPPHVIEAKNKKALAFTRRGKTIVVKRVNHPGTKGKYSFKKANQFVDRALGPQLSQAVEAAFNGKRLSLVEASILSALVALRG